MVTNVVFRLRGEIDLATASTVASEIRSVLASDGSDDLVLDCADLEFIDSSGLTLLVKLSRELAESGRTLRLTHVPNIAKRTIAISGLDKMLLNHK